jgi:hypothetical protein
VTDDACPICSRPADRAAAHFPFCGPRCKMADLGRWLAGEYRIPVRKVEEEDEDGTEPGEEPG